MKLDRLLKSKLHQHLCPFCIQPLTEIKDNYFTARCQIGYECSHCFVPNVKTKSGKSYSRYNIGVMLDVQTNGYGIVDRVIVSETFYVHRDADFWYRVHNDLIKNQTLIVLEEPMRHDHIYYAGDEAFGMVWAGSGAPEILPFVVWTPENEASLLPKVRTLLTFI